MTRNGPQHAILVFERRPFFGPELQRQFLHTAVSVRECRSFADVTDEADRFDGVVFVIDFDAALADCINWLETRCRKMVPRWPIIVCASSRSAGLEWIVREAGATEFRTNHIPGDELAHLCRRCLNSMTA